MRNSSSGYSQAGGASTSFIWSNNSCVCGCNSIFTSYGAGKIASCLAFGKTARNSFCRVAQIHKSFAKIG